MVNLLSTGINVFCLVISPILAINTSARVAARPQISPSSEAESLVQQEKMFYESGQYAQAVEVLQKAADAFSKAASCLLEPLCLEPRASVSNL